MYTHQVLKYCCFSKQNTKHGREKNVFIDEWDKCKRVKNNSLLKTFLAQFWNCFVVMHWVHASLHLELKTRPRFCLVSQSLSVVFGIVCISYHLRNESVGFKKVDNCWNTKNTFYLETSVANVIKLFQCNFVAIGVTSVKIIGKYSASGVNYA